MGFGRDMRIDSIKSQPMLERAINYLRQQTEADTYSKLIESLELVVKNQIDEPVVKILSPSASLAQSLVTKIQHDSQLRSRFKFQVVAPINKVGQIVRDCDLICLIYYFEHSILPHHRRLIELAQKDKIETILLVNRPQKPTDDRIANWLAAKGCSGDRQLTLALDYFIDLNNDRDLDFLRQQLGQLSESANQRLRSRIDTKAETMVRQFFQQKIAEIRQEITQLKQLYPQQPYYYRQKLGQADRKLNREQQQRTTAIKQNLHHLKSDLLNPFQPDSLSFMVQQLIHFSQPKLVREQGKNYLYLVRDRSGNSEYLHGYVFELCQQKVDVLITVQWSKINCLSVKKELSTIVNQEEFNIYPFWDTEFPPRLSLQPSLDIEQIIDRECLKSHSKMVFDYHFSQTSWFRLLSLLSIGWGIYLVTWLYFGTGRYIGLVIVVFQVINLLTGQSVKTIKLKQHLKELKRIVDARYQSLIRLVIDKSVQTLIMAVERQDRQEREQIERAIAIARQKINTSQRTLRDCQQKLNRLTSDRRKILALWKEAE